MDVHARSLLELLNTSSSPKPSKTSTPEPKPIATPSVLDVKEIETSPPDTPASPQPPRPAHAGPEESMSIKDLLVSARHESRQPSNAGSSHPNETTSLSSQTSSPRPIVQSPPRLTAPTTPDRKVGINASDGDSSANHEEMPTTPSGSNSSSLVSHDTETPHVPSDGKLGPPQGLRIVNDTPSVVTLSLMNPDLPRLQVTTDKSGRTILGEGVGQIANLARTFGQHDRDIIGATAKYIVYALKDGRIRIIDQNTGTRAIAETPSSSSVVSLNIRDGLDSDESFLLVLDASHDITLWSIKPWKVDSADFPMEYQTRLQTAGHKVDPSFPPIAKWWPRYANCLAVCTGLTVRIYVLPDGQFGKFINISGDNIHAISIPVETGVRDFSFSADGSSLAVVDYHGDILLWALRTDTTFCEFYDSARLKSRLTVSKPTIKFTLPSDLNPCSIQFLELSDSAQNEQCTPLLLVGSSYNRRLHLIDIGRGTIWQEIVLPSIDSENMPVQNFAMSFTKEKQFLTVGDTLSNSIFFLHLSTEAFDDMAMSQSDYIAKVAIGNGTATCPKLPSFDYVTQVSFFPHHRLQTLAVTSSLEACLDVFTAHSNGFTMLSPDVEDILPANYMEGVHAPTKSITHTVLDRVVDLRIPKSVSRTSSPHAASRRSSSASIRGAAIVVVKKEPKETPEKTASDQHTLTNSVGEARSRLSDAASAEQVSRSANAREKRYSSPSPPARPSLVNPLASITKDIEVTLNQALEQQYLRLIAEQKNLTSAADERHESILKVVSSTLTTNVGKLLEQTVRTAIEKSILPAINTTVKKSVDQHLTKTLSNPLDKTLPKEMRSAVNDAVQRALLDTDGGIKFSDAVMKPVLAKLEYTIQRDLPTRLGMMFEKSLVPMMTKMEERMQLSIDKSMQRIQKESRVSQLETTRKLELLTEAVVNITDHLKMTTSPTVSPEISPAPVTIHPPVPPRRQTMAAQFKAKMFSAGIEIWSDSSDAEQAALFEVCLDYKPSILDGLEQLSLMSVANAISIDFKTHLEARLAWIERIVSLVKQEGRYTQYWPRLLDLLDRRLDIVFEDVSTKNPKNPVARKIAVTQYHTQAKLKEIKK